MIADRDDVRDAGRSLGPRRTQCHELRARATGEVEDVDPHEDTAKRERLAPGIPTDPT